MPAGPERAAGPGAAFIDDPYPTYAALREFDPVHALAPGSWLLTRCDDVLAVYRDARASSDKRREFAPKFGDSPLFEHHTTSLVFNDPPLHTRVRRLLVGALSQRFVSRMEVEVRKLVDGLLDRLAGLQAPDLIEDFAAGIPVEVIGNLLNVPHADRMPIARRCGPGRWPSWARWSRCLRPRCWRAAMRPSPISSTTWPAWWPSGAAAPAMRRPMC